jgi:hypothetical protein
MRFEMNETEFRTDWAEKVVCEIANLLGLPVARYEFAAGYVGEPPEFVEGIVSVNFIPDECEYELSGEKFIEIEPGELYIVENVFKALDRAEVSPPDSWTRIDGIKTGADIFVGYILLDTLVNHCNRNSHNWGVMSIDGKLQLMPAYSHGTALGSTFIYRDRVTSLSHYLNEFSLSPFQDENSRLSTFTVFEQAAKLYPQAAKIWQERLATIDPIDIKNIFDRIPDKRISAKSSKFANRLLRYNRTRLLTFRIEEEREIINRDELDRYVKILKSEYEQRVASAFAIFTEDAINKIGQPETRLTEDSLFLMNNLIRDILKLEEDIDPVSENIRSDYQREFDRRLFSRVVKSDISLFATINGLSPIQSQIEFQMSEDGWKNDGSIEI